CDECKYDKISYDKSYKDIQQKIERLHAQMGDLKSKCKDTSCVSDTQNPLSQKLENENVELEFQVLNYARENGHLKATYKNLYDSMSISRAQTKTIIAFLQNELQSNIYKNAKLRTQLSKKVSDQKDNTQDTSANTKFAKQPIVENLSKVGKTNALSNPVTSNSVSTPHESKRVNNDKVIAPRMFRINPSKTSREEKQVPNTVIQICLWCIDSGCSKHMTGNLKLLMNFVWKFMRTVRFENDHVAAILGFGDLQWGNILITRVYFVEGLGHNLFSVIQIYLWCVDSGCSKHMTGNLKLLINFVWKFMGTIRFGNDHVAAILGFGDLQWGNILITRVYFVEGLGHNLFLVGQFCDSDLEVAFRRDACLLKFKYHKEHLCSSGEQGKSKRASHPPKLVLNSRQRLHLLYMNLYGPTRIVSINGKRKPDISFLHVFGALCYPKNEHEDIGKLGAKGVDLLKGDRSTNLYTINLHEMASASPICLMARASSTKSWLWHQRLSHLNFDTINNLARNDLVVGLLKFKYHKEHLCPSCEQGKSKRASHPPKPVPNSRQRLHLLHMDLCGPMRIASINGKRVVERRNRTLVEAARTMLIFSRAPLFLWAEAIATAYFTQNRSIIHRRFNKTPYELINGRKPDISFFHVFGALCYPKNDRKDIGKLGAKATVENVTPAQEPQVRQMSTASTIITDTVPIPTNSSSHATNIPITSHDVDELNPNAMVDGNTFVNPFATSSSNVAETSSSQNVDPSNMHTFYQPYPHEFQWTKDHPLEQVIGEPSR
nr:integrase, catalytic region, zinc finger, CCHC-type, peptidase aspartic, catalytic [Tanacetum cinerariifolium]